MFTPFLVLALRKYRGGAMVGLIGLAWGAWALFHRTDQSSFTLSFLFGLGDEFGPSILQGLTFVVLGYALGTPSWQRSGRVMALVLPGAALLVLAHQVLNSGVGGVIGGVSTLDLRQDNHPYFYAFGIIAALALLGFARLITPQGPPRFDVSYFHALGAKSIFAYGFGNMVLNLMPRLDRRWGGGRRFPWGFWSRSRRCRRM